jgi:hypothetical protein
MRTTNPEKAIFDNTALSLFLQRSSVTTKQALFATMEVWIGFSPQNDALFSDSTSQSSFNYNVKTILREVFYKRRTYQHETQR